MIKLKDILSELVAGRHDAKETLQILRAMSKELGVKVPAVKFSSSLPKVEGHRMFAHFDFDRNIIYINSAMNKNDDEFLKSLLHELFHAKQLKKYGRKFKDEYEKEISIFQAENPGEEDDWYKDNKFEIEAEKYAQKNWKKWKKIYDKAQMRKNPDNDGF
tara:strand:- start:1508 stop:1987 length:480 start_codon:yes stop_codon:yes gene_type:complete